MVLSYALYALALPVFLLVTLPLSAQDAFEIQVYEVDTVPAGKWGLETHLNDVVRGTKEREAHLAPSEGQVHLTFELTRGITDAFEIAGYLSLASRSGVAADFAATRIRPRVRVPEGWGWPIGFSLSAEVAYTRSPYEEDSVGIELRPILEKRFGRWQIDLNPVVTHALRGPGTSAGWHFEPAARVAYNFQGDLALGLEYYGALGPVDHWLPKEQQVHLLYPVVDYQVTKATLIHVGAGWRLTDAGNGFTVKARLGIEFD